MPDFTAQIAALRGEVVASAAQSLAHETLFFGLLTALEGSGLMPKQAISNIFEAAGQFLSTNAVRVQGKDQKTASGEPHTLAALRIVEELRAQFEKP